MTDRLKGVTVILDKETRIDDFEEYYQKIFMSIKGVVRVEPVINDSSGFLSEGQAKAKIRAELYKFIDENL